MTLTVYTNAPCITSAVTVIIGIVQDNSILNQTFFDPLVGSSRLHVGLNQNKLQFVCFYGHEGTCQSLQQLLVQGPEGREPISSISHGKIDIQ